MAKGEVRMKWFRKKRNGADEPGPEAQESIEAVRELLDRHHQRASISDGDSFLVDPAKVLENIALAMERVDVDIDTPISIEQDVVALDELRVLIDGMRLGPLITAHVVNTAMRIMAARYPLELVRRPLPAQYHLRELYPLTLDDREHETAKAIFNQRTRSDVDLDHQDVHAALEPLGTEGQIQVFVALFFMYGSKIGAMKERTGIE
jgi:hypothetical protein